MKTALQIINVYKTIVSVQCHMLDNLLFHAHPSLRGLQSANAETSLGENAVFMYFKDGGLSCLQSGVGAGGTHISVSLQQILPVAF